jgi:hypothetical protein
MALQKAISQLKPGENLNTLIVRISSITDPTLRAQEAMKIFGARGGAQLAQALQPGITSLSQFQTSTADTVGATNRAAQAIEDSWGARFTLLMHQAGGTLATFGQSFGPLLMVGAQLGPKMAAGLGGLGALLIQKIAEQLGLTLPTWLAGGAAAGAATAEAASVAEVATKQQMAAGDVAAVEALKTPLEVGAAAAEGAAAGAAEVAAESATIIAGGPEIAAAVGSSTPLVASAGALLGKAAGTAAALAMPAALAAAAAGLTILVANAIDSAAQGEADALLARYKAAGLSGAEIAAMAFKNSAPTAAGSRYALRSGTAPANYEADVKSAQAKLDAAQIDQMAADIPEIRASADMIASQQELALKDSRATIAQAAKDGYVGIPTAMQAAMFEANLAIKKGIDDQITSIKASKSAFAGAWSDAMDASTRAIQIGNDIQLNEWQQADIARELATKKGTAAHRRELVNQLADLRAAHLKLLVEDASYGTAAEKKVKLAALLQSKAMKDGLASTDADMVTMWQQVQADTQTQLDLLNGIMNTGGQNAAEAFIAGIAKKLKGYIIDVNGNPTRITIKAAAQGTGPVAEDSMWWVGEHGPELAYLAKGTGIIPHDQSAQIAGQAGRQTTININAPTVPMKREDIARTLRRAEAF